MRNAVAAGVRVVAITPDAASVLSTFATAHQIAYPLLSDVGGEVIQAFGLLNPNIPPNPRQATGQPFPGHFLVAPDGRVLTKAFTGDLRHRVSGSALVLEFAGVTDEAAITIANDVVTARITLSSTRLFGGQEIAVVVDLDIADRWHVYAESVPVPYTPLSIHIDTDGDLLAMQRFTMPAPVQLDFAATGESLPVHEGHVRVSGRARLRWSPPPSMFAGLEEAVSRRAIVPGEYRLRGTLRYQACNESVCLEPRVERFELPIIVEANVAPNPPL